MVRREDPIVPQRIYVARSRSDRRAVTSLVGALRRLGYTVALDDLLPGGRAWWSTVLERVAWSEVFVYAVSEASLDSEACKAQHRYATGLGIPALPVVVADGVADALVPPDLARLHRVDHRSPSKQAIAELHRSIESVEPTTPRAAAAPDVPRGFELDLAEAVRVDYLAPDDQLALVAQLQSLVAGGVAGAEVEDVLTTLRGRRDLTVRADERLAAVVAAAAQAEPATPPPASDPISDEPAAPRRRAETVFVSYSRVDVERVDVLAADLRHAGFDVWLDRELPGGMEWWNEILRRIRGSDVFVVAASEASSASRACAAELDYARGTRRDVLRIAIEPGVRHGVDLTYVDSSAEELATVIAALRSADVREVPTTLPPAPPVPASYLFDTRAEIRSRRVLTPSEQMALTEQLARHLESDVPPGDVLRLVRDLRSRDDLTVEAARALGVIERRAGSLEADGPVAEPEEHDGPVDGEPPRRHAPPPPPPPPPSAPQEAPASPPAEQRGRTGPRRLARRLVTAVGILALAVFGIGVGESLLDDARDQGAEDTRSSGSSTSTLDGGFLPSESSADADGTPDLVGTRSLSWVDGGGVVYAATLTTDGDRGDARIAFRDAFGTARVVHQDVVLELHDHGWAFVGSDPQFLGGPAAPEFATEFRLETRASVWVVVSACALSTGICAAVR